MAGVLFYCLSGLVTKDMHFFRRLEDFVKDSRGETGNNICLAMTILDQGLKFLNFKPIEKKSSSMAYGFCYPK